MLISNHDGDAITFIVMYVASCTVSCTDTALPSLRIIGPGSSGVKLCAAPTAGGWCDITKAHVKGNGLNGAGHDH